MSLIEPYQKYTEDTDLEYESDSDCDSEYAFSAQQQWEESIQQVKGLVNYVFFPLLGKLIGRRTAHILWRIVAEANFKN